MCLLLNQRDLENNYVTDMLSRVQPYVPIKGSKTGAARRLNSSLIVTLYQLYYQLILMYKIKVKYHQHNINIIL